MRTTFQFAFLRSVEPGTYKLRLNLVAPGGRDVGEAVIDLLVPEVGTQFSPDMAPTEASTLPAAEAIVIADEAERAAAGRGRREAEDPPAGPRGADRPAAPRGRRPAADHQGRVLPRGQADRAPHEGAVLGRDRPRRGAAQADGARRRLRLQRKGDRRGRLVDQPGLGAPVGQDPAADGPGRGQREGQGGRPVDRRRRGQAGGALPRLEEDQDLDRGRALRRDDPARRVLEGRSSCGPRRSPRTARKPTTSGSSRGRTRRSRACAWTSCSCTSRRSTRTTAS